MKKKLLIIGKTPPPIGGVTIHVKRLLGFLQTNSIPYQYLSLNKKNLLNFLGYKNIHLHSSNVYLRFLYSFLCKISNKNLILTIHGNLGRYNKFKNALDILALKFSKYPIVLNEESFHKAINFNKKTILMSSFLPPVNEQELPDEIKFLIKEIKSNYKKIYSTNAFALRYDINKKEIYGIFELIKLFKSRDSECLLVSDPSGEYAEFIKKHNVSMPSNVFLISIPHSYFNLLKETDGMIRNTTTDGDAISIKEALYLNKLVFATDVVSRPEGVFTYNELSGLFHLLDNHPKTTMPNNFDISAERDIISLYKKI